MEYGIVKSLKNICECILSVIYSGDEKCVICGDELYSDEFICEFCNDKIMPCKSTVDIGFENMKFTCYSGAYYSGPMTELVIKLKYKSSFRSGRVIARYMENIIEFNKLKFDVITYIPMTKRDLKRRGYNQSEYLARILGDSFNRPVVSCLTKIRSTKDQIGLDKKDRWVNIHGSFKIIDKNLIKNKDVLLVDDVITTGATAFYSAFELKNNGANRIIILTGAKSKV